MIGIMCASKGRPSEFARLTESIRHTRSADWPMVAAIENSAAGYDLSGWDHIITTGGNVMEATKCGVAHLLQNYQSVRFVLPLGDDVVIRTSAWDKVLVSAMPPDDLGVVYPDDGWHHQCVHFLTSRRWIETLGYLVPAGFLAWYGDTWQADIAARVGRLRYVPQVLFEHLHVFSGKAPMDATYATGGANKERVEHDIKMWAATLDRRLEDAEKMRRAIG